MTATVGGHRWQVCVDTGGTFTDCIAIDAESSTLRRVKVLSTGAVRARILKIETGPDRMQLAVGATADPSLLVGMTAHPVVPIAGGTPGVRIVAVDADGWLQYETAPIPPFVEGSLLDLVTGEPAPVLGARLLTATPYPNPLPPIDMRLATTRGTNALLQRKGSPTAFVVTRGFGDLLVIGDQRRPDLFALNIVKPSPLHATVIDARERIGADGCVVEALDEADLAGRARGVVETGVRSAAVLFLHSYVNPAHEHAARRILLEAGFEHVSCSSEIAPAIGAFHRAQTTMASAFLHAPVRAFFDDVLQSLGPQSSVLAMTSSAGLCPAAHFEPAAGLLSGPAGGALGAAAVAQSLRMSRVISLDMGGTSTDVSRIDGDVEYAFQHAVGDATIVAPSVQVESIAAGGGSVCSCEGRLDIGPESAGARPGPACYGNGGPLTLTDVNLLAGRLDPASFEIAIDAAPARARLADVLQSARKTMVSAVTDDDLLDGFLDLANDRMADAIRQVSIQRGYDPRDSSLVAFGGAGGQHGCAVAQRLGMPSVVFPADAAVLSARGLGRAVREHAVTRSILKPLEQVQAELGTLVEDLAQQAIAGLIGEGVAAESIHIRQSIAEVRMVGQESAIQLDASGHAELRQQFSQAYHAMYGYAAGDRDLEVVSLHVIAATRRPPAQRIERPGHVLTPAPEARRTQVRMGGTWMTAPVLARESLTAGQQVCGPALILEKSTTCVIEPGWRALVHADGSLVATAEASASAGASKSAVRHDDLLLDITANRLSAIAGEMGRLLQRVAVSTNVKDRLDFSCGLLDASGRLLVSAPHIPVHLGSLGPCVQAVMKAVPMEQGDVVITNHPAFGGSHLPDVTVISPICADDGARLGFAASRAHHAEIGGTRPGSMPPDATALIQEGVVIPPIHLVRRGEDRLNDVHRLLTNAPHPSRAVMDNLTDIRAAVAANQRGIQAMQEMAQAVGVAKLQSRFEGIRRHASAAASAALHKLNGLDARAVEALDDDTPLAVSFTVNDGRAVIDFTGSGDVHPGNLNATSAIVHSTVIYVLRVLAGRSLPLNDGLMDAVDLRVPHGLLNPRFTENPVQCPAVVGGNTEISQRLVDVLFKALGVCACSQGTMNNVVFGNEVASHYETICGGAGAGPGFRGADAVHTHMTNTRITDPEVLERNFPVLIERFNVRHGSGGAGRWRGGDGAVREYRFLAPMTLSILTQHRKSGPYGCEGGQPGQPGEQWIVRASGSHEVMRPADSVNVEPGDRFVLQSPGGGGFGKQD